MCVFDLNVIEILNTSNLSPDRLTSSDLCAVIYTNCVQCNAVVYCVILTASSKTCLYDTTVPRKDQEIEKHMHTMYVR